MATKRKLEFIFNLQWRNQPQNGPDKATIIGIYDTISATMNLETFKSYLLKNSGIAADNVNVTYVTDVKSEWLIDSDEWFEFVLESFRLKARLGEVIYLKLDRIPRFRNGRKHSNDVQTQFDVDSTVHSVETPPEWFLTYMDKFKRELAGNIIITPSPQPKCYEHSIPNPLVLKRNKHDKKSRRLCNVGDAQIDKELRKKFEYKLEHKLEKLEAKTKKIKEKKQAMINREIKPVEIDIKNTRPVLNAACKSQNNIVPHLSGGEMYLHTWRIENNGWVAWPEQTEIRLTWGSTPMIPSHTVLKCRSLQPGQSEIVSIRFQIPTIPGPYENYYNFYNGEERFGQALYCRVIVDEPIAQLYRRGSGPILYDCLGEAGKYYNAEAENKKATLVKELAQDQNIVESGKEAAEMNYLAHLMEESVKLSNRDGKLDCGDNTMKFLQYHESPRSSTKRTPPTSYGIEESDLIIESPKKDGPTISDIPSDASDISSGFDVVNEPIVEDEIDFVYITIDGSKLAVPKHIIHPDFIEKVEQAPAPQKDETIQASNASSDEKLSTTAKLDAEFEQLERNLCGSKMLSSHCSATGSCFSDLNEHNGTAARLFVFPQNNAGFECVNDPESDSTEEYVEIVAADEPNIVSAYDNTENPKFEPVPNFQQTQRTPTVDVVHNARQEVINDVNEDAGVDRAQAADATAPPPEEKEAHRTIPVHILPERFVNGAVDVASSAINTARSVINMIAPRAEAGLPSWDLRTKNLVTLADMGFWNPDLNSTLLNRYNDDISRVITELIQRQ